MLNLIPAVSQAGLSLWPRAQDNPFIFKSVSLCRRSVKFVSTTTYILGVNAINSYY